MEWASSELVSLLYYLLPGFFTAWIFYGLTAHRRPTPFERVVQALIFTAIVQVPVFICQWTLLFIGSILVTIGIWSKEVAFVISMLFALILGHVLAASANNNIYHRMLSGLSGQFKLPRWLACFFPRVETFDVTKRTSYPSEWFSSLNADRRYVTLHLIDGRRIFGWPYEWPDHSDMGHFVLMQAEWVLEDNKRAPLYNVERMMISVTDVRFVDILKAEFEIAATPDEQERVEKLLIEHNQKLDIKKPDSQTKPHGESKNGKQSAAAASEQFGE